MLSNLFRRKSICKCVNCVWINHSLNRQIQTKTKLMTSLLNESMIQHDVTINIQECGKLSQRIVTEVSFQRDGNHHHLGQYDVDQDLIQPIRECTALDEDLLAFVNDLDDNPPPIDSAGIRMRINPHGQRGLWIDASNMDIRILLNQQHWLKHWMQSVHVEMGQQRKYVQALGQGLSLEAPMLRNWFSTFNPIEDTEFSLWSVVGSDSQPSVRGTKILLQKVLNQRLLLHL